MFISIIRTIVTFKNKIPSEIKRNYTPLDSVYMYKSVEYKLEL